MKNCAYIRTGNLEFRVDAREKEDMPHVVVVGERRLELPDWMTCSSVEEITIYCGTMNLAKVVYYEDGDTTNVLNGNRRVMWCEVNGKLSTNYYKLKELK